MRSQQRSQKERQEKKDTINCNSFQDFVKSIGKKYNSKNPDRIGWDEYFMELAYLVKRRSPDSQTQHGAVIVDSNNRVISTGYNGFPSGGPDHLLPNERPYKYDFIIHAEMNAILSSKQDLLNCTMYVTGIPCKSCILHILGSGIKDIVFGDISYRENKKDLFFKAYLYSLYDMHLWKYDKESGGKSRFSFDETVQD